MGLNKKKISQNNTLKNLKKKMKFTNM